ncbi:hypothetical protein UlMin_040841 [Ulmus minor]
MANLKGKVETEIEIKVKPEKFFSIFRSQAYHVPNMAENIRGVDIHEGEWHSHGAIKTWKYTCEGKDEEFKEKVEFDNENKAVILNGVDGHVFEHFKSFKPVYQVIPKGEGSLAKLSIEYEKLSADVPNPDRYLAMMVNITKHMDDNLIKT